MEYNNIIDVMKSKIIAKKILERLLQKKVRNQQILIRNNKDYENNIDFVLLKVFLKDPFKQNMVLIILINSKKNKIKDSINKLINMYEDNVDNIVIISNINIYKQINPKKLKKIKIYNTTKYIKEKNKEIKNLLEYLHTGNVVDNLTKEIKKKLT